MKKLLSLLFVLALVLAACSSDGSSETGGEEGEGGALAACGEAPAEADVSGIPDGFPTPDGTTYTGGEEAGPSFIAEGYIDGDLQEAFDAYHSAFEDAGYDVTKDEKEDRDAEVFFAGEGTTGQVNMFADCEGRTKLRITIRPD